MVPKGFKLFIPPQVSVVIHTRSTGSSPEKTGVVRLAIPSPLGGGFSPHE